MRATGTRRPLASGRVVEPAPSRQDGFTLIEVVVALALLAVLSSAVLATVSDATRLSRTNEGRMTAAGVASRALEAARTAPPGAAAGGATIVRAGGVDYTVTTVKEYVRHPGVKGSCSQQGAERSLAQRVTVTVDWPGRPAGVPVARNSTIRPVPLDTLAPQSGTVIAVVQDTAGKAVDGATVALSPTGRTATTSMGCAVFTDVAQGSDYQLSVVLADHTDLQGVVKPSRGPLTVARGGLTEELFVLRRNVPESPTTGFTVTLGCIPQAVPAFRDARGVQQSTASTSLVLQKPTATQAGDLMVAHVVVGGGQALTEPTGWTRLDVSAAGSDLTAGVFYRWAENANAASYSFSFPSATRAAGGISAYSGVHRPRPVLAFSPGVGADPSAKSVTAPALTTTRANTRVVAFWAQLNAGLLSPPTNMSPARWSVATSGVGNSIDVKSATGGREFTTTGTTGDSIATSSSGGRGIGHTVVLGPLVNPVTTLTWTPTTWPSADGYYVRRLRDGGLLERDWRVGGRASSSTTDQPLLEGVPYRYELAALSGTQETEPEVRTVTLHC